MDRELHLKRRIRILLVLFIAGLVLSGLTAFALETELRVIADWMSIDASTSPADYTGLKHWIALVSQGLRETNTQYPFIAYGTDWLAFGHLVITLMFFGALVDPVRNVWVVTAGMIACVAVVPLALIAGEVRGIPVYWRLIDCGFGVVGIIPLWLARRSIVELQQVAALRNA